MGTKDKRDNNQATDQYNPWNIHLADNGDDLSEKLSILNEDTDERVLNQEIADETADAANGFGYYGEDGKFYAYRTDAEGYWDQNNEYHYFEGYYDENGDYHYYADEGFDPSTGDGTVHITRETFIEPKHHGQDTSHWNVQDSSTSAGNESSVPTGHDEVLDADAYAAQLEALNEAPHVDETEAEADSNDEYDEKSSDYESIPEDKEDLSQLTAEQRLARMAKITQQRFEERRAKFDEIEKQKKAQQEEERKRREEENAPKPFITPAAKYLAVPFVAALIFLIVSIVRGLSSYNKQIISINPNVTVTGEPTPLREEYEKMLAKLSENNDDSKKQTTSADSPNKTTSSGSNAIVTTSSGSSAIVTTPADSGSSGKSSYSTIGDYDELIANATAGEAHALNRALFYLENYPYSEASLRDQLHILDSCSDEETEFALEHCKVDWNANALTKANKYLEFNPSISREILRSTLEYDQYTQSQITYALTRCNGSWNK